MERSKLSKLRLIGLLLRRESALLNVVSPDPGGSHDSRDVKASNVTVERSKGEVESSHLLLADLFDLGKDRDRRTGRRRPGTDA